MSLLNANLKRSIFCILSDTVMEKYACFFLEIIASSRSEFEGKFRNLLQGIPKLQTTESLNRAVTFVAPQSQWGTFIQLRKDNDTQATYITEKSLLGTLINLLTHSEM